MDLMKSPTELYLRENVIVGLHLKKNEHEYCSQKESKVFQNFIDT